MKKVIKSEQKSCTYRLSLESIEILNRLSKQFSHRIGTQMSLNKCLDSLIKHCRDVTFDEIVKKIRDGEKLNENR